MKTIRHTDTLFYYDGIQLFEGRNDAGDDFLALLVEDGDRPRFLTVALPRATLVDFRDGKIDLRTLLLQEGRNEWYIATPTGGLDEPIELELQAAPIAECDLLPGPGLTLDPSSNEPAAPVEPIAADRG